MKKVQYIKQTYTHLTVGNSNYMKKKKKRQKRKKKKGEKKISMRDFNKIMLSKREQLHRRSTRKQKVEQHHKPTRRNRDI